MKIRRLVTGLALSVLMTAYLGGCAGKTETAGTQAVTAAETQAAEAAATVAASTAAQETEAPVETGESQAEGNSVAGNQTAGEEVDRYEQIIDRSGDEGRMAVYFLDLETGPEAADKSGDSTVLISPDGKVMLLDAGHPDCGEMVVEVLKDLGVEKIDYLVASHPHIDHIGGIPAVLEAFPVERLYRSAVEHTTQTYQNYLNAVKEHEVETVYVAAGDIIEFGEQVQAEVLGPDEEVVYPEGFPDNSTQFLNDESMLLKFTFGESTALFGGDLYVSQEREYVDQYGEKLQADVVKANHHGKDTSNSKKWIKTVNPVIVGAMGDEVGSMTVYDNYVKNGAEFHLTFCDGIVKVIMDDQKNYEVIDQKDSWMN